MIRVVIRKPLHPYLQSKAEQMGIDDLGEVVNFLLLQLIDGSGLGQSQAIAPIAIAATNDDFEGGEDLLDFFS